MRVYDFDALVYRGSPLRSYYIFCLLRRPRLVLTLVRLLWGFLCCCFGARAWEALWPMAYKAPLRLRDSADLIRRFWSPARLGRVQKHLPSEACDACVFLSTAPDYLLAPLKEALGLRLICMGIGARGRFFANRDGAERLARMELAPEERLALFCGRRLRDHAIAEQADMACHLRGGKETAWSAYIAVQGRRFGLLRHCVSPEFFRFWCVGWLNLAAAWILEYVGAIFFGANLGFAVGYSLSLFVSFLLNSTLTFRRQVNLRRFWLYVISYLPNFAVQYGSVFVLHNLLHIPYALTCFFAAGIGMPVTFFCLKFFAFGRIEDA